MAIYDKEGILALLKKRDRLATHEAQDLIDNVQEQVDNICDEDNGSLAELEDVVKDELGLEPDYLDCFLPL